MSYDDWTHDDWNRDGEVDFHDYCMEYDMIDDHREENEVNGGNATKPQQYSSMSGVGLLPIAGIFFAAFLAWLIF